jgi:GNAT superfamily N-acetyltransferase
MPGWKIERLAGHHDRNRFDCGNQALSDWFRQQSSQFEKRDLARTYVLVSPSQTACVAGYYSISTCQIRYEDLPPDQSKGLPRHLIIPAALLGKLAIDKRFQGQGLGGALLGNALRRMLYLADVIGIRVVVVDAIDEAVRAFYLKQGFTALPDKPDRLFIPIHIVRGLGLDPLSD